MSATAQTVEQKRQPMKQCSIPLPEDKIQELEKIAEESYSSFAQVARECLLRGLKQRLEDE